MKKKGEAMRERFGEADGVCGGCPHLVRYFAGNKKIFKCRAYGITGSVATDWKKSEPACGLTTQIIDGFNPVIEQMKHEKHFLDKPIKGQLSMLD